MDSIDKLLAEIKAEYEEIKPEQCQQIPVQPLSTPSSKSISLIDSLLEDVKSDFEQKDLALELQKQQQLEEEQIRQQQLKAQKQEMLKKQANTWLAKLDPFSPEGLWFERFAENYPSKSDAAIEYLQNNE
ncbi:hypothetical protein NUACC21_67630 [Scytonema sp. NUACC21]